MPGLRDLLRKKEHLARDSAPAAPSASLAAPEFTFIRSTTETEEVIQPPEYPADNPTTASSHDPRRERRRTLGFRKSSHAAAAAAPSQNPPDSPDPNPHTLPVRTPRAERRLSERLHLGSRTRSKSTHSDAPSAHLPDDLPEPPVPVAIPVLTPDGADDSARNEARAAREAQWEKRATILASKNPLLEHEERAAAAAAAAPPLPSPAYQPAAPPRERSPSISNQPADADIQEAIRLHESGDLTRSTQLFGTLADPQGANNALSQVLYGLALRHGWGIPPEPERAIHYLSLAASNSAAVERAALEAGLTKGGAAKGELVLAIFELANCFRHGWGVKKDPVAARQYYETAANLGDTDAMEEAAWCFLEGFGGGKDKFKAAQLLRLAEQKGSKSVGNSWIWKEKYNPK